MDANNSRVAKIGGNRVLTTAVTLAHQDASNLGNTKSRRNANSNRDDINSRDSSHSEVSLDVNSTTRAAGLTSAQERTGISRNVDNSRDLELVETPVEGVLTILGIPASRDANK